MKIDRTLINSYPFTIARSRKRMGRISLSSTRFAGLHLRRSTPEKPSSTDVTPSSLSPELRQDGAHSQAERSQRTVAATRPRSLHAPGGQGAAGGVSLNCW